jgi:hypothetical protein
MICDLNNQPTHALIRDALQILVNLDYIPAPAAKKQPVAGTARDDPPRPPDHAWMDEPTTAPEQPE